MFNHSKFRHVFGTPYKRDQCYDNIRISKSSHDGHFVAVNPKFVAIITECAGGGSFLVLPLSQVGRVLPNSPQVTGHQSTVLDLAWCPFNDNVIASGSEDATVRVWYIPDEGIGETNMSESIACLRHHQRKVTSVLWHPVANNVILSAGADNLVVIWNLELSYPTPLVTISQPELINTIAFNYNGSKLVTICKDQIMRVYNARSGEIIIESDEQVYAGRKPAQVVYLKDGRIFTTGFDRRSERKYALWDENDLSKPIVVVEIDKSNGVLSPQYDPDVNIMYLCGKGDRIVNFYEILDKEPYVKYLNCFTSNNSARGIGFMPKRGLDINKCEIARMYKLHSDSPLCEVINMTVPRKSDLFQGDLYPDTASNVPALTPEQWFDQGIDQDPLLMNLKDSFDETKVESTESQSRMMSLNKMKGLSSSAMPKNNSTHPQIGKKPDSSGVNHSDGKSVAAAAPSSPSPSATEEEEATASRVPSPLPSNFDAKGIMSEMKSLKDKQKKLESRVKVLEARVAELETRDYDIEDGEAEVAEV